jgi:hypothetical protein
VFSFVCMFWIWIAAPIANAGPYLMNDVGGTLTIPDDWEMTRWSDWDFKAKGANGSLMYKLWLTPYQSEITDASADAYAAEYLEQVEGEGGGDATVTATEVKTLGGRSTAITEIAFKAKGGKGSEGVFVGAAIAAEGQMIHSRIIASKRNARVARTALEKTLDTFSLKKGPAAVEGGDVESDAGFAAALPDGWRLPVDAERSAVVGIASKMWKSEFGPEECWLGIRPPFIGEPDVAFACKRFWDGRPVDEHSFSSIEAEWRDLMFSKAGAEIPPGEQVMVGDRVGALFRPRDGANPLRVLVAHYDGGLMAVWLRGASLDAGGADAFMLNMASTVRFTGPEGGVPQIRPDRVYGHYVAHRPTHPIVWGPALLLIAVIGLVVRRRGANNPYAEFDDE